METFTFICFVLTPNLCCTVLLMCCAVRAAAEAGREEEVVVAVGPSEERRPASDGALDARRALQRERPHLEPRDRRIDTLPLPHTPFLHTPLSSLLPLAVLWVLADSCLLFFLL